MSSTAVRRSPPTPHDAAFRRTVVVVLLGAALLAALIVVIALRGTSTEVPADTSVAVIGDSYSTGTVLGGLGDANWTARLGLDRSWRITDTAVGGTGYVQGHDADGPFASAQLDRALRAEPELVVVAGSINDGLVEPSRVGAAASSLYAALRQRSPGTRLVVVGPPWPSGAPTPEVLRLRDAVAGAARAAGAVWIDPIAEGWFDSPAGLIGADGVHPTDAGHALMAHRIGLDLHAAGL